MRKIYISLSREDVLRNWEWVHDEENQENGSRELHIFPELIDFIGSGCGSKNKPHHEKFQFIQTGNSYGPDFDYSKISIYGIDDMFDQHCNYMNGVEFNYSEVRYEARKEWAMSNDLDFDIVEENHLNKNWEHYETLNDVEDEWVQTTVDYNREVAGAAMKDDLVDEGKGIIYKIVWED